MSDEGNNDRRPLMRSELDYQLMTTDSVWGRKEFNSDLDKKMSRMSMRLVQKCDEEGYPLFYPKKDADGKELQDADGNLLPDLARPILGYEEKSESVWATLGIFTRDLRLSNLDKWNGEVEAVSYYMNLAHDMLAAGYPRAAVICMGRVAAITEPTQSRGGFFRRRQNTLSQEHINIEQEPKKASLFGKARRQD